jgi:hypothetical protein
MIDKLFTLFLTFYYFENGDLNQLEEILADSKENIFKEMTDSVERTV